MSKYEIFSKLSYDGQWEDFMYFSMFNYINHTYSVFNSALILVQRPGATIVKSEIAWNHEQRLIKPEASPIVILQPMGPVMLVYDYYDTYSKTENDQNIKETIKEEFNSRQKIEINEIKLAKMVKRLERMGIVYAERSFGQRQGGFITVLKHPIITKYVKKRGPKKGQICYIKAGLELVVNSSDPPHKKALTIFHELGHLYCGHLGGEKTEYNKLPEYRDFLSDDSMEFEAEMVSQLICQRYGFRDDDSEKYLYQHMKDGKAPYHSISEIIGAADKIITMLAL